MTSSTQTLAQSLDDLVRATDLYHEQHSRTLRVLQDGLNLRRRDTIGAFTPPLRPISGPTFSSESTSTSPLLRRPRAGTLESNLESPLLASSPSGNTCPVFTHDDDVNYIPLLDSHFTSTSTSRRIEEYSSNIVKNSLTTVTFSDEDLLRHLYSTEFSDEVATLFQEAIKHRPDMDFAVPFHDFAAYEREGHNSSTFEVYEVGRDCSLFKLSIDPDIEEEPNIKYTGGGTHETSADAVDASTVWETIRSVNSGGQSVGRITIVQEPTPLILAALHFTMSSHFDVSELLTHLITDKHNQGHTHAFMNRAFERSLSPGNTTLPFNTSSSPPTPLPISLHPTTSAAARVRQRSFLFVFKYYTVVREGLEPASWQRFDQRPPDKRTDDHIDIAECGSVLALSLGGEPTKHVRMRPRRERAKEGVLFDTFGPWQLLAIQSFPDDAHTVRGEEFQSKKYVNGPHAFLDLLIAEYRDAGKRNQTLHEHVTKLITPPTEFMFDPKLRDKLLFEDKHFTYIRRYFWAYNTLAVVNTGIKAMVAAYFHNFNDDFWAGTDPVLWPHPSPESGDAAAYREHMAILRRELEKVVHELGEILKRNERTRKEIENLRDQLFSGSSIKESRRAIEQGDNIRILTMISMIFLPLTFVTSVFGMTEFHISASDWRFAVTMILVCVPFILLISLLQTRYFGKLISKVNSIAAMPGRLFTRLRRRPRDVDISDSRSTVQRSSRLRRTEGTWPRAWASGRFTWPRAETVPMAEIDLESSARQ